VDFILTGCLVEFHAVNADPDLSPELTVWNINVDLLSIVMCDVGFDTYCSVGLWGNWDCEVGRFNSVGAF
jgi:hypothetical protein